jgi:hypothetical protein
MRTSTAVFSGTPRPPVLWSVDTILPSFFDVTFCVRVLLSDSRMYSMSGDGSSDFRGPI